MQAARTLIDAVVAHARASPDEVCGLLFGTDDAIERAMPTRNVAADPSRWFEVDPAALIAALRAERQGGACLIGHYHSHPGGRPEPSPHDRAAAEPGRLWLIVGGADARLWRAEADGFRAVPLTIR